MKKISCLIFFLLSLSLFFYLNYFIRWPFNYHIVDFLTYVLIWSMAMFIMSLPAFLLGDKGYHKQWLTTSILVACGSIIVSILIGDGNGSILSFDGESISFVLAILYCISSLIYIGIHSLKNQKHKKVQSSLFDDVSNFINK